MFTFIKFKKKKKLYYCIHRLKPTMKENKKPILHRLYLLFLKQQQPSLKANSKKKFVVSKNIYLKSIEFSKSTQNTKITTKSNEWRFFFFLKENLKLEYLK